MIVSICKILLSRIPWGLLGMLALVAIVETQFTRHEIDFSSVSACNWRYSAWQASHRAVTAEVLCLGTSLVKFGVLPQLIEDRTSKRALNLAVFAGHMPASFFLLRRALNAGAHPAAVLVDCQDAPVLRERRLEQAEGLRVNLREWPELLRVGECIDLAYEARDANFLATMMVSRVLPSYKARCEIRANILAALRSQNGSSRENALMYLKNWICNQGANVVPRNAALQTQQSSPSEVGGVAPRNAFRHDLWTRNKLSQAYTHRLLELAASRNIPVFWLLPPLTPPVQAERDETGVDDYLFEMVSAAQLRYRNVFIIDGRRSGYKQKAFYDATHLDRQGASVFSADVASLLERYFTDPASFPRQVSLPQYHERPVAVPVIDLDQTRIALERAGLIRRR